MTNPYRALCAELLNGLDELAHPRYPFPGYTCCAMDRARAALAEPEAEGPTDEQLNDIADETPWHGSPRQFGREVARAALARWGRPAAAPVPVSERLPGPEDCDAKGRYWGLIAGYKAWVFGGGNPCTLSITHWLPANALPLPALKGGESQP